MATQRSPLLGYNHNLKYKGRVYHVQTEDSGLDNPHIFTHLFHDGTIFSTQRQDYGDILGDPNWEKILRGRMQEQHKEMMKGLIRGSFDERIIQFFGTLDAEVEESMPQATLPPAPHRERRAPAASSPPTPWQPAQAARPVPQPQPQQPVQPPLRQDSGVVVSMPMVIVDGSQHQAGGGSPQQQPPQQQPPQQQPPASASTPETNGPRFSPDESKPVPESIFGSEIISEKSLDEVILAYLSEDLADD